MHPFRNPLIAAAAVTLLLTGCASAGKHREEIDQTALKIIEQKQMEALGRIEPFSVEPPEDTLRRRLMIDQNIPHSSPASLNTKELEPIEHWPKDDYLDGGNPVESATADIQSITSLKLTLLDALEIAAKNNRQYQTSKENVFRSALDLDLARDQFRNTFAGSVESTLSADLNGNSATTGLDNSALTSVSRRFMNGVSLSARIGFDLVKMLNPFDAASHSLFGDASISIPLLRGSGKYIVAEPLTQAERNALYAIYDFEQYKRSFVVDIASNYLATLQVLDQIDNAENNYRGLITSTRLVRRLADAGKRTPIEVDQSVQQELSARNGWISAQIRYQSRLDSLKLQLGLPPDVKIELNRDELQTLTESSSKIIRDQTEVLETEVPPADAPVTLEPLTFDNAGPMEIDESLAIQIALDNHPDLRIALGQLYDAQRKVTVAADALRAEFTLLGSAAVGESRSLGSASRANNEDLAFEKGRYNALLSLDLPIERTREIISYRESILTLERAVRTVQETEDSIKLNVRNRLRDLQEAREGLQIQAKAAELANRRVRSTTLSLQAGRSIIRDVLESQSALLSSENSLTSAMVNYRIAELELQRDLGVLQVNENGIWTEFSPEEYEHERPNE
ncbi:MAG: TolC family protein [bacterium]|nr:TolC family protein [bacterium]